MLVSKVFLYAHAKRCTDTRRVTQLSYEIILLLAEFRFLLLSRRVVRLSEDLIGRRKFMKFTIDSEIYVLQKDKQLSRLGWIVHSFLLRRILSGEKEIRTIVKVEYG